VGRQFSTNYNWLTYFKNQEELTPGVHQYQNTEMFYLGDLSKPQRLLEYYKFAAGNNLNPEIKISKSIKLV
jgi:hypothetical protein